MPSGLSKDALYLLFGDIEVGLDANVHVFLGNVGGSLKVLSCSARLPDIVEVKTDIFLTEKLGTKLDAFSLG